MTAARRVPNFFGVLQVNTTSRFVDFSLHGDQNLTLSERITVFITARVRLFSIGINL